jgi:putative GTP pyrophosphokinase
VGDNPIVDLMSTSQVDRLGERLRGAEVLSEEDLALLQRFRAEHEAALIEVQSRLEGAIPGVAQAARIKTIQTLHDKLRRQSTKLSRIQDIAGVRIVEGIWRLRM